MEVCVACAFYKLVQKINLLVCSELFSVGRSIVSFVVRKVIKVINIIFKRMISWPSRSKVDNPCLDLKTFVIFQVFIM